jgi:hypothetical protein
MRRVAPGLRYVAVAALVTVAGAGAAPGSPNGLRVSTTGPGTVTSADNRIRCGNDCSAVYRRGKVVALEATPRLNASFERWTGDCVGAAPRCLVAVDRTARVHAVFRGDPVEVSLSVGGPGTVYSEPERLACGASQDRCTADFPSGTTVLLSAVPAGASAFRVWAPPCDGTTAPTCALPVSAPTEISAAFESSPGATEPQRLTLAVFGRQVSSDPPGLACPPSCSSFFPAGTLVTLRGSGRSVWRGACVGSTTVCMVVADRAREVTASLAILGPRPPPPAPSRMYGVSVSVSGRGLVVGGKLRCGRTTGTVFDCAGFYRQGDRLALRAVPTRGSRFVRWGGFCEGRARRCTLRVTAPKIVIATFAKRHD